MPIFSLENERLSLVPAERATFSALNIKERQDLQRLLRDHPAELESIVGDVLLVFSEEYDVWNNSKNRIDLLALDREANLVVIELKITEDGGHSDLQALRYAAMIRSITFEKVVASYQMFLRDKLERPESEVEAAEQELLSFLNKNSLDEVQFSKAPRIILISAGFSTEIITTALWLIEQGLSIECYTAQPYTIEGKTLLSFDRLLPVQTVDVVTPGDPLSQQNKGSSLTKSARNRPNAVAYLEDQGVLKPGARLRLVGEIKPNFMPPEDDRYATFVGNRKFRWGDQDFAISPLCRAICEKYGVPVGSGAFQGPLHWSIENSDKTLDALRDEYLLKAQKSQAPSNEE